MADLGDEQAQELAALAEKLRASGALGRSDLLNRLFDFLLAQSLRNRSPKEFEVAQEVFGKDTEFDMAQDASVRVYIHRLRKKLDEVYAQASGPRLIIPRGEYRLAVENLVPVSDALAPVDTLPVPLDPIAAPRRRSLRALAPLVIALLVGIAIGVGAWAIRDRSTPAERLATTDFWKPLTANARPTMVTIGDYYIFGEAPEGTQITRLIREYAINSREDLDQYLMEYPAAMGRYIDLDLHYLPISAGQALADVLPAATAATADAGQGRPRVVTVSRLTPEFLKRGNVVYVGFLSGLGQLRDPVFKASGFTVGSSYDELIDRATGKHYVSGQDSTDTRNPRRDYAYLASFPGPSGNRVLIIAGTRDPAVLQAAEAAGDQTQLDAIAARAGNADAFEALYEVQTLGTLNVGSNLVVARPLKTDGLWRAGGHTEAFPDEMPPSAPTVPPSMLPPPK